MGVLTRCNAAEKGIRNATMSVAIPTIDALPLDGVTGVPAKDWESVPGVL
jgi:hypothetical protein